MINPGNRESYRWMVRRLEAVSGFLSTFRFNFIAPNLYSVFSITLFQYAFSFRFSFRFFIPLFTR